MPVSQPTGNLGRVCGEESINRTFSGETLNYCVSFARPSARLPEERMQRQAVQGGCRVRDRSGSSPDKAMSTGFAAPPAQQAATASGVSELEAAAAL